MLLDHLLHVLFVRQVGGLELPLQVLVLVHESLELGDVVLVEDHSLLEVLQVSQVAFQIKLALSSHLVQTFGAAVSLLLHASHLPLVHGAHLIVLVSDERHVDVVGRGLLPESHLELVSIRFKLGLSSLNSGLGVSLDPTDSVLQSQVLLSKRLILLLRRSFLKLKDMLQLHMVTENRLVVSLLLMQLVDSFIVVTLDLDVPVSKFLFELGLLISKSSE